MSVNLPVAGLRRFQRVRNNRSGSTAILAEDVPSDIDPWAKVHVALRGTNRVWVANSIEPAPPQRDQSLGELLSDTPRTRFYIDPPTDPAVAQAQLLNLIRVLDMDTWLAS